MTDTWWVKQGQLDPEQKNVFTLPITDDYLVKGPPGSGKTNVLLLWGKRLIGSNIPDIVVVVHTRTLQEFIRSGAPKYGIPSTKIVTFRKFGTDLLYRVGAGVTLPADFDKSREVLVDALQAQISAKRIQQEYACVLVDEAQDFLPGEIDVMRVLGQRFFGVADEPKGYAIPTTQLAHDESLADISTQDMAQAKQLVEKQYQGVMRNHDQIKMLRDQFR